MALPADNPSEDRLPVGRWRVRPPRAGAGYRSDRLFALGDAQDVVAPNAGLPPVGDLESVQGQCGEEMPGRETVLGGMVEQ